MASGDVTADRAEASKFPGASFDGVDDVVSMSSNFNLSSSKVTISFWVFGNKAYSSQQNWAGILSQGNGSNNNWAIYRNTNTANLQIGLGATSAIFTGNVFQNICNSKAWNHILITCDGTNAVLYVNGVSTDTKALVGYPTYDADSVIRIASSRDGLEFGGILCKIKVWTSCLNANEIAADYAGYNSPRAELILDVPLEKDYNDKSPTGLTGTNSGSYLTNTIPNKLKADANSLNLAAVTDKIIALPVPGIDSTFTIIGANREA